MVAGARLLAAGQVPGGPGRVSNVVFMGMGEPLANYARVIAAVRRLTEPVPEGMGISQRSVTVSTVGLVPAIARLAAERLSVTLAVSLHAPDDELRDTLVPVNQRWNVHEVLAAAWDYAAATGRRVSIEYALIKDINDQAWRADALGSLLAGRLAHVNLIPLNPSPGSKWTATEPAVQREFIRRLESHGVPVTVRDTRAARSTAPAVTWPRLGPPMNRCWGPSGAGGWSTGGGTRSSGQAWSPQIPRPGGGSPRSAAARWRPSRPVRSSGNPGSQSARTPSSPPS